MSKREIEELLAQADDMPISRQEQTLLIQAVALAVASGDEELEYAARMRLSTSTYMSGDYEETLASWAWCLGKFDEDPVRFPLHWRDGYADVLWQYKWMAALMADHPQFSSERVSEILADMETRFIKAGLSLSGVWQTRIAVAFRMGRYDEALAYLEKRDATDRDDYSHCEACTRSEDAVLYAVIGDEERALQLYGEIMKGRLTCGDEPEHIQSMALIWLLRAGRLKEALTTYKSSLQAYQSGPNPSAVLHRHIEFLTITGNEARALAMLERYLPKAEGSVLDLVSRFYFLLAVGLLADSTSRLGFGATPVRGSELPSVRQIFGLAAEPEAAADEPLDGATGRLSLSRLGAAAWASAASIAEAFDVRNGTSAFADRIVSTKALVDERYDLPLDGGTFVADELPPPVEPKTAEDWVDEMRECLWLKKDPDAVRTAFEAYNALGDSREKILALRLAAQAMENRGREADGLSDGSTDNLAAKELVEQRANYLREYGFSDLAAFEERLGARLLREPVAGDGPFWSAEVESANDPLVSLSARLGQIEMFHIERNWDELSKQLAVFDNELARVAAEIAADSPLFGLITGWQAAASFHRMHIELQSGDFVSAVNLAAECLAKPEISSRRPWRVLITELAVQALALAGDFSQALSYVDKFLLDLSQIGHRSTVAMAAALRARILADLERFSESAEGFRYALRQANLAGISMDIEPELARSLLLSGASDEAVELFSSAYAKVEDQPISERLDLGLWWIDSLIESGAFGPAYGVITKILDEAKAADEWMAIYFLAERRAKLNSRFQDDEAVADFELAVAAAIKVEDVNLQVGAYHLLGQARVEFGVGDGLADFDQAMSLAQAVDMPWLVADIQDTKGRALLHLDRVSEGVSALLVAADSYAACGDIMAAVSAEIAAARALVLAEQGAEAVVIYHSLLERLAGTEEYAGFAAELVEVQTRFGITED